MLPLAWRFNHLNLCKNYSEYFELDNTLIFGIFYGLMVVSTNWFLKGIPCIEEERLKASPYMHDNVLFPIQDKL